MRPACAALLGPLVAATTLACASVPPAPPATAVDVQGHRGARGLLPENTLPAFERALELGVTTLELDTGMTGDGVVVVTHDRRISGEICRRADGSRLPGGSGPLIRDLRLAEVRAFDCGALNPDPSSFPEPPRRNLPGTRIPTLQEVFDLAAERDPGVRFNIEVKIDPTVDETVPLERFVGAVVELVRANGLVGRTTLQSFDWRVLELGQRLEPGLQTAALLSPRTVKGPTGGPSPWLNGLSLAGAGGTSLGLLEAARDYVDVFSPYWRLVLPGAFGYLGSPVDELQAAGFPVVPWTVNSRRRMEKILDLGVDGLITDYPDRLVTLLRERGLGIR